MRRSTRTSPRSSCSPTAPLPGISRSRRPRTWRSTRWRPGRRRGGRGARGRAAAGTTRRGAGGAGGRARARARRGPAAGGITVAGEVKNYVPVTDAMLRQSSPNDWLMIRRDYHASNYSPLNQITRDNVRDLRLQWVWAMNEGGANQPAPLVHNGDHLSEQPGQHHAGDRWPHRRSDLGKPLRHERERRRHARDRHLRRQGVHGDQQCAAGRARCQDRQDRLADHHRRSVERQLQHQQRPARGQGQADPGPRRMPGLPGREMFHQRVRRRHRQRALAVLHDRQAG